MSTLLAQKEGIVVSEWAKHPPAGGVWLVSDLLLKLQHAGMDAGKAASGRTTDMLDNAKGIFENEQFWRRAPVVIDGVKRKNFRSQLGSALQSCRGYN